jgi:plasmid stability protein
MDTTIRNLDERTYRALKARAAAEGRTIGDTVNDAIRASLARPDPDRRDSLASLEPRSYPQGNERLSEEIDTIVYGVETRDRG